MNSNGTNKSYQACSIILLKIDFESIINLGGENTNLGLYPFRYGRCCYYWWSKPAQPPPIRRRRRPRRSPLPPLARSDSLSLLLRGLPSRWLRLERVAGYRQLGAPLPSLSFARSLSFSLHRHGRSTSTAAAMSTVEPHRCQLFHHRRRPFSSRSSLSLAFRQSHGRGLAAPQASPVGRLPPCPLSLSPSSMVVVMGSLGGLGFEAPPGRAWLKKKRGLAPFLLSLFFLCV